MKYLLYHLWHTPLTHLCAVVGLLLLPLSGAAQTTVDQTTLVLRPHCQIEDTDPDWIFGNIPAAPQMIELGNGRCTNFDVEDPQTLRTPVLQQGDILDIDIVVNNPRQFGIQRVRTWLSYDPTILEGTSIEVDPLFPQVTPGEEDFDPEEKFVMIEATAEEGKEPTHDNAVVARVQFTVIDTPAGGTTISFYDVQPGGHTEVIKTSNIDPEGESAVETDPGSLHVIFGITEGNECLENYECISGSCINGVCSTSAGLPNGASCLLDSQCESEHCVNDICGASGALPDGSDCAVDGDCASGNCVDLICESQILADGASCGNDAQCASGRCLDGICRAEGGIADGGSCIQNSDCANQVCTDGICGTSQGGGTVANGGTCTNDADCKSNTCLDNICWGTDDEDDVQGLADGESCGSDTECESGNCVEGICWTYGNVPDGGSCTLDDECDSFFCKNGICVSLLEDDGMTEDTENDGTIDAQQTAFSLLQVQNVQVSTEGTSAFLAWDSLASSQLKAYNIYYGTTSGKYIQRKTVEGSMQTLTIRPLPANTTYYFAIRAVNTIDEESAFSNEVAVTIGNPGSSTSPLAANVGGFEPQGVNPVQGGITVPGETGLPSTLVLLLLASAIIGTILASRRQLAVTTQKSDL